MEGKAEFPKPSSTCLDKWKHGRSQENAPISIGWPWSQNPKGHQGQNQQVGDKFLYLPPRKLQPWASEAGPTAVLCETI